MSALDIQIVAGCAFVGCVLASTLQPDTWRERFADLAAATFIGLGAGVVIVVFLKLFR